MMTDPIADMLTRIRNAQSAKRSEVEIPYSRIKLGVARILESQGYVEQVIDNRERGRRGKRGDAFTIKMKYIGDRPAIESLKRISKPGLRVYISRDEIENVRFGYGFSILTTSQGLMTNREARTAGVGGEVLCEVY